MVIYCLVTYFIGIGFYIRWDEESSNIDYGWLAVALSPVFVPFHIGYQIARIK